MLVPNKLREYHNHFQSSVQWRNALEGIDVKGSGVERTKGEPKTVTKVWETYGQFINQASKQHGVPVELIIATICTETSGNPIAVREEPGFKSDEETPSRISSGLMQTLLSTAKAALKLEITPSRSWLMIPENSINAGTAYIAFQLGKTGFDPPLVAAAYNAGGVYLQEGENNRWKLRQYPLGTGHHVDRFVKWFNDAVFVLKNSKIPAFDKFEF